MPKEEIYNYQQLDKMKPGNDKVSFYAVVLDAQFPHKSFKSDKYLCSLKIADQSSIINKKDDGSVDFSTLVLFANKFEDLPVSQKIGEIIRVHRAGVGMYKN
jgi:hypothetical protein